MSDPVIRLNAALQGRYAIMDMVLILITQFSNGAIRDKTSLSFV